MGVVARAPKILLIAIAAAEHGPRSWITVVLADCRLLATHTPELAEMRDRTDLEWITFIASVG
eukprot:3486216-Karenia_brevis.AAC.1